MLSIGEDGDMAGRLDVPCCEYAIKMACTRKVTQALEVVVGDLITIKHEFLGSWRQPLSH